MLRNIPSSVLKQLVKLSERREALMSQIQEVDRDIVRLESKFGVPLAEDGRASVTVSTKSPKATRKTRGRRRRGALREGIIGALRAAGKTGTNIRQLSEKLRVPPANLYVWFNSTGKKVRGLKKIGPATYRLSV